MKTNLEVTSNGNISNVEYSGTDVARFATIKKDKLTKSTKLTIKSEGEWIIYGGRSVEAIDFNNPILNGYGNGEYQLLVPTDERTYFQLNAKEGRGLLAEHVLPMAGGFNFRDLGGIQTNEGRFVKWGMLIRADELNKLTESDLKYLASLPLQTIVDFRSPRETEKSPDIRPQSLKHAIELPIEAGNQLSLQKLMTTKTTELDSYMSVLYRMFVTDAGFIDYYRRFFAILQQNIHVPLLFHCTAGKDRTGMAAALILMALGVDQATIMDDYMATNTYLKDKYSKMIEERPMLEPVLTAKKEYLQAVIEQMIIEYGTCENYIRDILNVDIEKFKDSYLFAEIQK